MLHFGIPVRRAMIREQHALPGLLVLVPAARMFAEFVPSDDPVFPFTRLGPPTGAPLTASGINGQTVLITWHCWDKGGAENAAAIVAAFCEHFGGDRDRDSGYPLAVDGASQATLIILSDQILQDPDDPAAFHGVVNCSVDVIP